MSEIRSTLKGPDISPAPSSRVLTSGDAEFLIKVNISYYLTNAAGIEEKHSEDVVFELTRDAASMPWYVLRNYYVPRYLNSKYGKEGIGWKRLYEIIIIKLINRNNRDSIDGIPIRVMTSEQLKACSDKWELGVPVHSFHSVDVARMMLALRMEDPLGYEKTLADYKDSKTREYPELDSVRAVEISADRSKDLLVEFDDAPKNTHTKHSHETLIQIDTSAVAAPSSGYVGKSKKTPRKTQSVEEEVTHPQQAPTVDPVIDPVPDPFNKV
jgi:hypothetical protein